MNYANRFYLLSSLIMFINLAQAGPSGQSCCKTSDAKKTSDLDKKPMPTLATHLRQKRDSINTIRISLVLTKPDNLDDPSQWHALIAQIENISNIIANTELVQHHETSITAGSNGARTKFIFGAEKTDPQGSLEIVFGASDCCACCYPECKCAEMRSEGVCECNDKEGKMDAPASQSPE